ncbi:MAG: excinuclease ABC subunit UvrC [Bacillota bacterium]|nr:excinuclease ABC subunit UvrC [Bacillota bacterium]
MDKKFWQEKLNNVPKKPGVYLFRDEAGEIIYVGKAESLKNRVSSYFQESKNMAPKTLAMRERARSLETIVVDSPTEALILECNLIKLHRPHYNIMLKDDKTYPYLKITTQEEFPRLLITRNYKNDGSRYFGPYTNSTAMKETVALLRSAFPLRNCGLNPGRTKGRTCLNYDIGNCSGPCVGKISKEDYKTLVDGVIAFLNGDAKEILTELEEKMLAYSAALDFENAALCRDNIQAINEVLAKQKITAANSLEDRDYIAIARDGDDAVAAMFFIRRGKLIAREHRFLSRCGEAPDAELYRRLLPDIYDGDRLIPPEICLGALPVDSDVLNALLRQRRGGALSFHVPQRG